METFNITQAELNKLEYIDNAIRSMKSDKQKLAIEIKQKNKARKKYEETIEQIKPIKMFTLHDRTIIEESELTDDMIEIEIEFGFNNYK